jgi:hypothetical protein
MKRGPRLLGRLFDGEHDRGGVERVRLGGVRRGRAARRCGCGVGRPGRRSASLGDGGAPKQLVSTKTSCAGCLYDSFSPDGRLALAIDPIDNSAAAGGVGPLRIFDLASGAPVATFGAPVYTTIALDTDAGQGTRLLVVEATPDAVLANGQALSLYTRGVGPTDAPHEVAVGVEQLAVESSRRRVVFSFEPHSPVAGIWVAPIQ